MFTFVWQLLFCRSRTSCDRTVQVGLTHGPFQRLSRAKINFIILKCIWPELWMSWLFLWNLQVLFVDSLFHFKGKGFKTFDCIWGRKEGVDCQLTQKNWFCTSNQEAHFTIVYIIHNHSHFASTYLFLYLNTVLK